MIYLHHHVLAFSLASILVSYALPRSIKDELLQKELAEPDVFVDPADVSVGARDLSDLLRLFRPQLRLSEQSAANLLNSEGIKRSSSSWSALDRDDRLALPIKRKTFWSPLGHLPASARLGRPRTQSTNKEHAGSSVFRYG